MKKSSKKFLEFKGKNIYFLDIEGIYWIAIKPICEVLNVDFSRQLRTLKSDEILGRVWSLQTMHDSINRLQNMVCLPEKFVYGWIFSIQSASQELKEYKKECYEILFDYFRGAIVKKQEVLEEKAEKIVEKTCAFEKLKETEEYKNFVKLNSEIKVLDKISKSIDDTIVNEKINQLTIFD